MNVLRAERHPIRWAVRQRRVRRTEGYGECMIDLELYESLTDELRSAIRLRDAADPDAPPWEAEAHARRRERMIDAVLDAQARDSISGPAQAEAN